MDRFLDATILTAKCNCYFENGQLLFTNLQLVSKILLYENIVPLKSLFALKYQQRKYRCYLRYSKPCLLCQILFKIINFIALLVFL